MTDDDQGFIAFVRTQGRPLLRTAWVLTGDWHAAQDLVQETLARMYSTWDRPGGLDSPQAFAHVVMVRTFISQRRRRMFWERPTEAIPDARSADAPVERRLVLQQALARLRADDRAVLVLRYVQDRSVEQVAQDLGKTPGAIRIHAMRALERLRGVLGADQLTDLSQD